MQGLLSDSSMGRQTSFPPCDGFSKHAEILKHFARPNHQELIQYPFIALKTLTKEEKELFLPLPQKNQQPSVTLSICAFTES